MPRPKPDFVHKAFMVRIHPNLHGKIVKIAEDTHRTLNGQSTLIFETWFDADMLRKRLGELERSGN